MVCTAWVTVAVPVATPVTVTVCGVFQLSPALVKVTSPLTVARAVLSEAGRITTLPEGRLFSRMV